MNFQDIRDVCRTPQTLLAFLILLLISFNTNITNLCLIVIFVCLLPLDHVGIVTGSETNCMYNPRHCGIMTKAVASRTAERRKKEIKPILKEIESEGTEDEMRQKE